MKLLSVFGARCAWIVDMQKLNPTGRSLADILSGLQQRYTFSKSPQHLLDFNKENALEFQAGTFRRGAEGILCGLQIYSNGLIGDTISSTDDSEAFLEDLAKWLATEHKLPIPPTAIVRKFYVSQLYVQSKASLSMINPKLIELANKITAQALTVDGKPRSFAVSGLSFWTDDFGQREAPAPFKFERRYGVPPDQNEYFSMAPLRTQEHLRALDELEAILSSRAR